jgi:hypothetical protein
LFIVLKEINVLSNRIIKVVKEKLLILQRKQYKNGTERKRKRREKLRTKERGYKCHWKLRGRDTILSLNVIQQQM